jgi:hypothetical protein
MTCSSSSRSISDHGTSSWLDVRQCQTAIVFKCVPGESFFVFPSSVRSFINCVILFFLFSHSFFMFNYVGLFSLLELHFLPYISLPILVFDSFPDTSHMFWNVSSKKKQENLILRSPSLFWPQYFTFLGGDKLRLNSVLNVCLCVCV